MKKSPLIPLFFTVFLDMVGIGVLIPVLPVILLGNNLVLGASVPFATRTLILGMLLATYPIFQFFGAPLLGAWSDHVGRRKVLFVSLAGTFIGYVLFAVGIYTNSLALLFVSRALDGFTGGSIAPVMSAIADISDSRSKAKNFGLVGMAFGLGFILGPFIGGQLAAFGATVPFIATAVLTLANISLVAFLLPETLAKKANTRLSLLTGAKNIVKAFSYHNVRTMLLVSFLSAFGFTFFTQFSQVYMMATFGYNESQVGNVFAYVGIWIAITQGLLTRLVARKYAPPKVLRFALILLSLSLFAYVVPRSTLMLLVVMPFIAIGQGLIMPNSAAVISNLAGKDAQGEIMGINQSLQALAIAIPPLISGAIVAWNVALPTIVGAAIVFVAWAVFMALYHRHREKLFVEV